MSPPTRVSHHLLQAQTIHNEVRAQRDELAERLRRALEVFAPTLLDTPETLAFRERCQRALQRVDSFTKTEGETQL